MAPPPTPVDPVIDSWRPSSLTLSPTIGLDTLLQSSLTLPDRLAFSTRGNQDPLARALQLPAMHQHPPEPNPILRYWNDQTEPWNPQRVVGPPNQTHPTTPFGVFDHEIRIGQPLPYDRRSEVGSNATGIPPHDSGYGGSGDSVHSGPDGMDPTPYPDYAYQTRMGRPSETAYQRYQSPHDVVQPPPVTYDLTCPYENCGHLSKNQSEHRKHRLRHDRPYKCDVPRCTKQDGFSTQNDLARHQKSVHGMVNKNDRSFRCAARNCPKKDKIWPRLDNFRQHCLRIHPDEPCDELVRKSVVVSSLHGSELDPGYRMDANNVDNSSNHEVMSPGINPNNCPGYVDPSVMLNYPNLRRISPNIPSPSMNTLRNTSHLQSPTPKPSGLLQVPRMNPIRKPSIPLLQITSGQLNWDRSSVPENSSRRPPNKNKRVTSTKKAQEVSDEVALDIAKTIDFNCSEPKDIQAAIQQCVFRALNQGRSKKRPAPPTSSEDDVSRKHQKRHTRPYGCTFPGCYKKLGSKNDWKRHENTQHYQMETWRCTEVDEKSQIGQCASIFYRREQFQGHLREKHQINNDEYVREQSKSCRIGRNGQKGFWCGFCKNIVKLEKKGLAAWEERFDHIDDMHYKKGQSMDDWVQLDSDLTNGAMGRGDYMEDVANESEDDNGGDDESIGDHEDDRRSQMSARSHTSADAPPKDVSQVPGADADAVTASVRQPAASRRTKIWTCNLFGV
ncbi:MAG: hypothetical protein Q9194_007124 [Teloschistes cf. exilis]